jgi:hypothetical protein
MFTVSAALQNEIMDGLDPAERSRLLDNLLAIKVNLLEITAASANREVPETGEAPRVAAGGG